MNLPFNALRACVYYAVKALLDPDLAPNAGLFDPISVSAPVGTITNPEHPAAVGARSITAQKVAGAIFGAFRGLLPAEKTMASSNDCCPAIVFSAAGASAPGTSSTWRRWAAGPARASMPTAWTRCTCT